MKQCPRCQHWHHSRDSLTCDACWEDMGQMQFWHDESNGAYSLFEEDEYLPPIDTVFDREEEARGYQ